MKYLKYLFLGLTLVFALQSCSKDETETTTTKEETESSSETTSTEVVLTIKTSEGVLKADYIIMMFNNEFDPTKNTPTDAAKTIKSDSKGIATFNLENEGAGTYSFEAFTLKADGTYILESTYRTKLDVTKGTSSKTTILVN